MSVRDYGDQALLLELDNTAEALAWSITLREAALPGVIEVVGAARTVLLQLDGPGLQQAVRRRLDAIEAPANVLGHTRDEILSIEVVYDGADLDHVAEITGLTADEVVDAHTATVWNVGFCGFAPGFAYLVGGDPRLQVPRRAEPRSAVPAGAVGLAGEFTGVYPRRSPGGWQLIGRTSATLWDVERADPALLTPGRRVRFRAV